MSELTSAVTASALIRLCEQMGGFGTVLAKGDPTAGAIVILLAQRGQTVQAYECVLQAKGSYEWRPRFDTPPDRDALAGFIDKRRRFDPDLWLIELDVASAERFAAQLGTP